MASIDRRQVVGPTSEKGAIYKDAACIFRRMRVRRANRVVLGAVLSGILLATGCSSSSGDADSHGSADADGPTLGIEWASNQEGYGTVKPTRIYNGGSVSGTLDQIEWSNWGDAAATGTGFGYTDGVYGSKMPAEVRAFDLGDCQGSRSYRAITWWFPSQGEVFDPGRATLICSGGLGPTTSASQAARSTPDVTTGGEPGSMFRQGYVGVAGRPEDYYCGQIEAPIPAFNRDTGYWDVGVAPFPLGASQESGCDDALDLFRLFTEDPPVVGGGFFSNDTDYFVDGARCWWNGGVNESVVCDPSNDNRVLMFSRK